MAVAKLAPQLSRLRQIATRRNRDLGEPTRNVYAGPYARADALDV